MTGDEVKMIMTRLEQRAREAYDFWSSNEGGVAAAIQLSIAISLRRIADALSRDKANVR